MNRYYFLILIFFTTVFGVRSQSLELDHLEIITKNILSFHFRYSLNYDLNLKSDNVIQGDKYFFDELWPKAGQDLELDILPSDLRYPLKGFTVFEIRKNGFQIGDDKVRISKRLTSFQADDVYLVALDSSGRELKFISGNFFHSSIQDDFDLNIELPESFIPYIRFRAFNWSPEKIRYESTKKGKLFFCAYSKYLEGGIQIEIDKADLDLLKVKQLKKKVTY